MRHRVSILAYVSAFSVLGLFLTPVSAQESPAESAPELQADDAGDVPLIDALADQRVRDMSDFLAKQQKFRFSVEITYDSVEPNGEKIQLGRRSRVEVMRPNGLRAESQGDRGWNQLSVFDGHHFTLLDRKQNLYCRVETPDNLDDFFKFLFEKYGVSPPLVDFLLRDVHGAMTDSADSGALLGDAFVAEHECDHVAFSGESLDWQVWIEKGDAPWPRKFVITYKDVDVRPQFMAVFREWRTDATLTAARFEMSPPKEATEVPLERFVPEKENSTEDADSNGDANDAEGESPEGD